MLKDTLTKLNEKNEKTINIRCRLPQIYAHLDEETQQILTTSLLSNAPTRAIANALSEEGHSISREAVNHARRALNGTITCECTQHLNQGTNK
jgi:hypothetical protein